MENKKELSGCFIIITSIIPRIMFALLSFAILPAPNGELMAEIRFRAILFTIIIFILWEIFSERIFKD